MPERSGKMTGERRSRLTGIRREKRELVHWHPTADSLVRLGQVSEPRFAGSPPRPSPESAAVHDGDLEDCLHAFPAGRGTQMKPFHNMAPMWPTTTSANADRHCDVLDQAVDALVA
jgi:hypothetical protein